MSNFFSHISSSFSPIYPRAACTSIERGAWRTGKPRSAENAAAIAAVEQRAERL